MSLSLSLLPLLIFVNIWSCSCGSGSYQGKLCLIQVTPYPYRAAFPLFSTCHMFQIYVRSTHLSHWVPAAQHHALVSTLVSSVSQDICCHIHLNIPCRWTLPIAGVRSQWVKTSTDQERRHLLFLAQLPWCWGVWQINAWFLQLAQSRALSLKDLGIQISESEANPSKNCSPINKANGSREQKRQNTSRARASGSSVRVPLLCHHT